MSSEIERIKKAKCHQMTRLIKVARQINTRGWVDRYGADALAWALHRSEDLVDEVVRLNAELAVLIPHRQATAEMDNRLPRMILEQVLGTIVFATAEGRKPIPASEIEADFNHLVTEMRSVENEVTARQPEPSVQAGSQTQEAMKEGGQPDAQSSQQSPPHLSDQQLQG